MATNRLSDGNATWAGGMDTSLLPSSVPDGKYAKAINLIHPETGGLSVRFGFQHCYIIFDNQQEREIYETGHIQGEGYFVSEGKYILIVVVSGYVFRLLETTYTTYKATIININDPNSRSITKAWVSRVPNGCIINNGFDFPLYVTENTQRRTDPSNGEIGIGMMGQYVQKIFFYVDQSGRQIIPSDFNQPLKRTDYQLSGIVGFFAPDEDEIITAIGKQKTILGNVEGGNLIFSTNRDIYSVDVRGPRSQWANVGSSIGKVSETIPSISACSSYSFETFNANIYFRSACDGIANIRQSEYQFTNLDVASNQAIEANYFLDNDTDWMLHCCYSRKFNQRLLTTVAPARTENGYIYWNGILSFNPVQMRGDSGNPSRYESVFTGVRPWCLTSVARDNKKDILFVHSYDLDGKNRMYMMDGLQNYDVNHRGKRTEIKGYLETRAYGFGSPTTAKTAESRVLNLSPMDRSVSLNAFARSEINSEWIHFYRNKFLIARRDGDKPQPLNSHAQPRQVVLATEKAGNCFRGDSFYIQYRFEFEGPIQFDWFVVESVIGSINLSVTEVETVERLNVYEYRPDYSYFVSQPDTV